MHHFKLQPSKKRLLSLCKHVLLLIVLVTIYLNIFIFEEALNASGDFQWTPTKELLQHKNPYESFISGYLFLAQMPLYPLTGYILLIPYAVLEWPYAKIAWVLTNYVMTIIILYCLQKLWKIENKLIVIFLYCAFLISGPYRDTIRYGQHDLYVLALFMSAVILSKKHKSVAGVLLGLSWFKYSTTFPLSLYFIFKQEWKAVLIGILTQCILIAAVCLWLWESPLHIFINYLDVLKIHTSYWAWHLFHQYSYIVFIIPIWWSVHYVEIRLRDTTRLKTTPNGL
jgi:hypothetical protein